MKKQSSAPMTIVFLTTYPPRACGLATFSQDLIHSFDELFYPREDTKVIAMNADGAASLSYPEKVFMTIDENDAAQYEAAAQRINAMPDVKVVSVQHEFGIYGANDGENIVHFMRVIEKPVIVTFHTVLPRPSERMLEIVRGLVEKAGRVVVMTDTSKVLLENVYGAPAEKVRVIHHGIHPLPYIDSAPFKKRFGLENKKVLATFGLLNRGKGIEFAIDALPSIVKSFPDIVYVVIGATHPVVMRREGPVYLNELKQKAKDLGVENNIVFVDRYVETSELLAYLQSTDVYLSLSQNPDQAVSGTLTYALGAGKPVISTSFMQAKEVITPEVGRLIGFNESASISEAVIALFSDPDALSRMSKAAYFRTRGMVWQNVALSYMNECVSLSPDLAKKEKALPRIDLNHLEALTDAFGIFQFAQLTKPDPQWGYTLDDNARSLVAVTWHHELHPDSKHLDLARTYLSFIERSQKAAGGFDNYFTPDTVPDEQRNSSENLEDSQARALWATAEAASSNLPEDIASRASDIFKRQYAHVRAGSPRAAALCVKACAAWLKKNPDDIAVLDMLVSNADFLAARYAETRSDDWKWFEDTMTYSNAVLPEALTIAYSTLHVLEELYSSAYDGYAEKAATYFDIAKESLEFLYSSSMDGDICMPIGQGGWFKKGGEKKRYDQQPEEVSALVLALYAMREASSLDQEYKDVLDDRLGKVFGWFFGNNALKQVIYSHLSGGCYDGLGERDINLNQGAESTVSYLLARMVMEKA